MTAATVAIAAHSPDKSLPNRCGPECVHPTPAQAHCAARSCGITFGSAGGFDKHRRDGRCVDPAGLGMTETNGVWRTPISDDDRERLRAIREADGS